MNQGLQIANHHERVGSGPGRFAFGITVLLTLSTTTAARAEDVRHEKPSEILASANRPNASDDASIKVGATVFTDYTYTQAPRVTDADKNSVHKSEFEVRRAYVNVTGTVSDLVSFRITPDVAARQTTTATGLPAGAAVSGSLDGSLVIRLKYAFAQLNLDRVTTKGSWIRFGQQQTPYVDFIEGIYRYRFQGTVFVEREGFVSSSDIGISGRWAFPGDHGDVHAGYYNGDTYARAEANDQKAFQIRGTLRPLPRQPDLKGLRLSAFYDLDHPVQSAIRKRIIGAITFEHRRFNSGLERLDAEDNPTATKPALKSGGWSIWATPRTAVGVEGLFRYDVLTVDKSLAARKRRTLVGAAYWFKVQKAPLAAAVLADYERVAYDDRLARATEKRFEFKTLVSF